MFVTIIEIDVEPGIDLTKYVGVSGRVRATDSNGKQAVLRFVRGPEHDFDDFTLTDEDGWRRRHSPLHNTFLNDAALLFTSPYVEGSLHRDVAEVASGNLNVRTAIGVINEVRSNSTRQCAISVQINLEERQVYHQVLTGDSDNPVGINRELTS
mgnify:CR=1 FL=1